MNRLSIGTKCGWLLLAAVLWCAAGCAPRSTEDMPATLGDLVMVCGDGLDQLDRNLQACTEGHDEMAHHIEQQAAKIQEQADALDRCNAQLMRSGARP